MSKKKKFVLLAGLAFWLILKALPISPGVTSGEETSAAYQEDFLTTAYLDAENTTVDGWGTGEIYCSKKSPVLVDTHDIYAAHDVFVEGNYAYVVSEAHEFCVVDISDPTDTVIVATLTTSYDTRSVFISGNYAYITYHNHDGGDGMQVVDISDPTNPAIAGGCYIRDDAEDIYIDGNYAYVAAGWGLEIVDIRDPRNPTPVYRFRTDTPAFGVFVSGNYAYVIIRAWMQVVDISDPESPFLAGSCYLPGVTENSLYVNGDYAYVAAYDTNPSEYWGEFYTIDISDPTSPTLAGSCETDINDVGVFMKGVAVEGDYAYVAHGSLHIRDEGLHVIDISDPQNPVLMKSIVTNPYGTAKNVFVEGNYAYIAGTSGLSVVAISDSVSPTIVGQIENISLSNVFISGNYAYASGVHGPFHVIGISDPTNPVSIGQYDSGTYSGELFLAGDYAYITAHSDGWYVLDISDPANPTLVWSFDAIDNEVNGIDVDGDYAFIADYYDGLQVFDISDPTNPTLVGGLPDLIWSEDVFVDGDYAFVANYNDGLQVLDISDPTSPIFIGSYQTHDNASGLFVTGDYTFVLYDAGGSSHAMGLQIIDISDPSNPTLIGEIEIEGSSIFGLKDLTVEGDYAYIAGRYDGLIVLDISDPANPALVWTFNTDDNEVRGIDVDGDYAYLVCSYTQGLMIAEVRRNKVRQYESPCYAQSMPILEVPHLIFSATLDSTATVPEGTSINYFLSADNGLNWEQITLGLEHIFTNSGTQLRWRVEMTTTDTLITPEISEITIDYTIENSPPLANAGPDQVVYREWVPLWVQLDGTQSYDPDGDPISCLWTITSKPEGSLAIIADPMSLTPRFEADLRGEYIIELVVNDPWTSSLPDTVVILRENNRPNLYFAYIDYYPRSGSHLDVGINQLPEIEAFTWLAGTWSDGDRDQVTYNWSIISKPPGSLAEIPSFPSHRNPTFQEIGIDLLGYYLFRLIINDGYEDSLPAYVSVSVLDTDILDFHEDGETIITEHDTDGTTGNDVWVTLTEVTETGDTTVEVSASGPTDPSGFELAGVYYDISTDATYNGPVMVSINYDDTGLTLEEEQNLRLFHYEVVDPAAEPPVWDWVDVTVLPVDTENNIICGRVSSLSWLAVGIQLPEVQITFPSENTALMDGVTFAAQAVGASDITEVNFYIRGPGGENGIPIGYEGLSASYDAASGQWQYEFDTIELDDGNYILLAIAKDTANKEGWSEMVLFSIRNWAVLELLPNTPNNKAGRTMPVKFALRISDEVDPLQPFAYSEELEIRIYDELNPDEILQTSTYGEDSKDYRIDMEGELYITNFKTKKNIITTYVVEIWKTSNDFKVGSFTFNTAK